MERSRGQTSITALLFAAITALSAAAESPATPLEHALHAHRQFLADDLLEGRGAGTRGHQIAAHYVAAHFQRLGLASPEGANTHLQTVPLIQGTRQPEQSEAVVIRNGIEIPLIQSAEFISQPIYTAERVELQAPLVFAGYGVEAPEFDHNDFANIDLTGKVVVVFTGAPPRFPTIPRAYYSSAAYKTPELVRRGAVGIITIATPSEDQRRPWPSILNSSRFPAMRWLKDDGSPAKSFPELKVGLRIGPRGMGSLFDQSPKPLPDILTDAEAGRPQGFDLPGEIRAVTHTRHEHLKSDNVLGFLPGKHRDRSGETIVLTAHLDHMGIGPEVNGDAIYNGAFDNAIGIAMLLEVANALATSSRRLDRSVLFAAVTAEERGLLGSEFLAANRPKDVGVYVANINLDMVLALHDTPYVAALGAEHSSLLTSVQRAARRQGIQLLPDPWPQEVIFIRSDQFSFVQKGVPSLFPVMLSDPNPPPGTMTADIFRKEHYHKPSDDLTLPIHHGSAARFVEFITDLVRDIANASRRPEWNPGDFLGEKFTK